MLFWKKNTITEIFYAALEEKTAYWSNFNQFPKKSRIAKNFMMFSKKTSIVECSFVVLKKKQPYGMLLCCFGRETLRLRGARAPTKFQ